MGMKDMILSRQNRPLTILRQGTPNHTNAAGMPDIGLSPSPSQQIRGRLVPMNARQAQLYQSTLGVMCDWELVTLDGTLLNGDRLTDWKGRIYRVAGGPQDRIGMGTLDSYYKYPLESIMFQGPVQ